MKYKIRQGTAEEARSIWEEVAPMDVWNGEDDFHWCAYDEAGKPVAFASLRIIDDYDTMYFTAAGVLPEARGAKLQRRLIRVRCAWAKRQGCKSIITYTVLKNYPSIMNLLKEGFRFYEPEWAWVGRKVHYFIRKL